MQELNQNRAPKVVIFFEGFNDVWAHCNAAVTQSLNGHIEERRIQAALDRTAKENYLYNNIIAPIMVLWSEAIGGAEEAVTPSCSGDLKRADAVAEMTVRNLEMAATLVEANGGRFHAFLQPNAYIGRPRIDYLELTKPQNLLMRTEFEAVYPRIRAKMAERSHPWFFDISRVLDNVRYLLIDHAHVTEAGNRLLAEAIKSRLAPN
jgi:lysophospholipase L1-like esterase